MAQVIAPEVWQDGIDDNQLLPNRYTVGLFTGRGINLANDGRACRVYDIVVSDYITDYDDRRLNGLSYGAQSFNADGRDGWGASAYGVFQDVRFTSKVYTMGRHRSTAMRIFDEMQYEAPSNDAIGKWGSATESYVSTNGQALLKTAALMSKAKDRWQKQVLGPDMDKYVLFAICSGHQTGRLVGNTAAYNDHVFDGDASHYTWQAQPGTVQGEAIAPTFAPIHCIEWDEQHIPQMLQNVKVTWNNLFIDQSDRVVLIDPFYEYSLLSALTGSGVPATDSAYTDLQNGSFTRLMGWDFNFEIPSNYWPKLYVDDNLNVIHTQNGAAAYDAVINSINGGTGDDKLLKELLAADRMSRTNWLRTDWDATNKQFVKTITNYPLGAPAFADYYGEPAVSKTSVNADWGVEYTDGVPDELYPWRGQGMGYGLAPYKSGGTVYPNGFMATGPVLTNTGTSASPVQVIGMFLWKKAAQMSQEYSEMVTDEGRTRGKFQEMCMDVKYDAWVIENYSHGIIPIIDTSKSDTTFSIPVSISGGGVTETPATLIDGSLKVTAGTSVAVDSLTWSPATPVSPTLSYAWSKSSSEDGTYSAVAAYNNLATVPGASGTALTANNFYKCEVTASGTGSGKIVLGPVKYTSA